MFRSRFFWKLFLSYALIILLTVGSVGVLVLREYRQDLGERMEAALSNECIALAYLAEVGGPTGEALEARVYAIAQETGRRITVVGPRGEVLTDSDADSGQMENHLARPEIAAALADGFGKDQRRSETVGAGFMYVAHAPTGADGLPLGVIRVAVSTQSIDEDESAVARLILAGGGIATLVSLLVVAYVVRRVAFPLERMRRVATALSAGDYEARVPIDSRSTHGDELSQMASALNRLGFDMRQRVSDLTAGQDRLRAMVAGMIEGVVAVDEDDRVTFSNRAARVLLGISSDTGTKRLWDVAKVTGIDDLLRAARQSDSAAQCELELSTTDEDAVVRAQAHRFQDGDSVGVVLVLHDISELRRLERIRRDFVANVSHELKTPLTSIRGYVETLLDGAIDDEDNNIRFLEKIENNVLRLNHLVTDLLSLAKIEAEAGYLSLNPIDLGLFVEEARKRHETNALRRDQRLAIEIEPGAIKVMADREALTQIIDNLIDNALKYTPDRGRVTVRVRHDDMNGILEVSDDGIGIPLEDQARVFERFYRVDKARSRAVGGTGLGLSIVKHLVHSQNGTIELESQPKEGTTFRVQLELAPD